MTPTDRARELGEYFSYDPYTGVITREKYISGRACRHGKCGGLNNKGYIVVSHDGHRMMAGRLAWILFYGKEPAHQIDHINGDRTDNRIINLRDVSSRENNTNRAIHRDGRRPGWRKHGNKYYAFMRIAGKTRHIGTFATSEEAADAYEKAQNLLADQPKGGT